MRIAYGVHGYGRGHSSRALAVLPALTARHDVLLLAGDDAYDALSPEYDVVRLPVFRYALDARGRRSALRTLRKGIVNFIDLRAAGPGLELVCDHLRAFEPDVVISDSEAWTHWAARRLGLPRMSFDHFGVLVYCRWPMGPAERVEAGLESWVYRRLMAGEPARKVIVSFYDAPPRRPGVRVVGPVLRQVVHEVEPADGEYLMVYFSNGRHHYTSRVEGALKALHAPVVVYGTGRTGADGRLEYRPPSNTKFVEDLAGARAVFATAGNQLISEAMHFGKPLLLLPEDSLEQRLNARAIEEMGIGRGTSRNAVSREQVAEFLDNVDGYHTAMPPARPDGRSEAVEAIEAAAAELIARGPGR